MDADAVEIRVLGSLIEKQHVTPDVYPLTLNALRLACNQSTNREPVLSLEDGDVRAALERLGNRGWTRLASWSATRTPKYRHLLDEALGLAPDELALLCVLMLRGPQTPGELKARTERLHAFPDRDAVEASLTRLADRGLVDRRGRRPGQKEDRYAQLLGGGAPDEEDAGVRAPPARVAAPEGIAERVDRLERGLAELRGEIEAVRGELGRRDATG